MRVCSLCHKRNRLEIDKAYFSGLTIRAIAKQFGTTPSTAQRHKAHVSAAIKQAVAEREEETGKEYRSDLLARLDRLFDVQWAMVGSNWNAQSRNAAVAASRECRETIKAIAQMTGVIDERAEHKHMHLHVDEATLERVAQTYLERLERRRQLPQETGG